MLFYKNQKTDAQMNAGSFINKNKARTHLNSSQLKTISSAPLSSYLTYHTSVNMSRSKLTTARFFAAIRQTILQKRNTKNGNQSTLNLKQLANTLKI